MMKRIIVLMLLATIFTASTSAGQVGDGPKPRGIVAGDPNIPRSKLILTQPGKLGLGVKMPLPAPLPEPDGLKLKWRHGSSLEACTKAGNCLRRALPRQTGKPIAVIKAPLINERLAPVSVLVVSNKRYSLCYIPTMRNTAAYECFPVKAPIVKGGRIKAIHNPALGTVLDLSIDERYARRMSREEIRVASTRFFNALRAAQVTATKVLSARSSRKPAVGKVVGGGAIQRPMLVDASPGGGGSCSWDGYCSGGSGDSGGGGFWPDEVPGDGGGYRDGSGNGGYDGGEWGEPTFPDAPTGADDGGGYPHPIDDPDVGGGQIPAPPIVVPPALPWPPGRTPNPGGGTTDCFVGVSGMMCDIRAPRPDPNTTDPETGQQIPPSEPSWSWCDFAPISWFCGGTGEAPQSPPVYLPPPVESPYRPPEAQPITRHGEGYQDALDQCDRDYHTDKQECGLKFVLYGGPIYKQKQEDGERLTPSERKMLREANTEFSSCMKKVDDRWGQCYKDAQNRFRE